jgi:hypothetical protein
MGIPVLRTIHDPIKVAQLRLISRYALVVKVVAIVTVSSSPFWLGALFFTSPRDYSYTSSLICVPLIALVCAVAVAHFTQGEPYLRRLLMAGLVAHMAASSAFLWIGWFLYGGAADAFHYWTVGLQLAEDFRTIGWSAFHPPYWSSNLLNNMCGVASLLIGDALPTLFITFAFISLWAGYFFYRAFTIAFPDGDRWLFGLLVVLLPSILFWSSIVGKDSLIQFFIGVTCFGFAKLNEKLSPKSVLLCVVGLTGVVLVRAHVAAMLAVGMTFPYIVGRPRAGHTNKLARIILIPVLLGGTFLVIGQAAGFLGLKGNDLASTAQEANDVTKNSQVGGSAANQGTSLPVRIAEAPFLMFRPFPWEMSSALAIAASVESAGLLFLCWTRRRQIWLTLRDWQDPYVGFILMYSIVFSVAFSGAISNFGILVRQRIMMVPLVLMLVFARQKLPVRGVPPRRLRNSPWLVRPVPAPPSDRIPKGI